MPPKVQYSKLGFEESAELPEYYNDGNFRYALLSLVKNLIECRQLVAKIIRENWEIKELIGKK